ncbi:MAG: hypothetical protein EAX91_18285 [Candidatus Lokiarchaeota archaeon]|nr:hypothetical protein [Candidatus Lokiarchaeota archaeon]
MAPIPLTPVGWLNGFTASGVFLFSVIFGLFAMYKARKLHLNPLFYIGLTYFFAGLIFTGDFLDFLTVLITQNNMDNSLGIIGLINWMWFPGVAIFGMYFGAELIVPKKKWTIFTIYLILGIIFDVLLFLFPSSALTYTTPVPSGSDLINDSLILESIPSILAMIFLISILILDGFGFLRKGIQSTGIIRRKFFYLSLGAFLYIAGGILDGLFDPGFYLIFVRAAMIVSAILFYLGVKK